MCCFRGCKAAAPLKQADPEGYYQKMMSYGHTMGPAGLPFEPLARLDGVSTLLSGIEFVALEGTTRLGEAQITTDLRAFRSAGAQGLVLSWDLWHIPLKRPEYVR